MDSGPYFEDFEVGRTYTGPERTLSPTDVAAFAELSGDRHPVHTRDEQPLVHGPLGIACFFGWLYETGLGAHVEAALDTRWRYLAPLHPGDRVSYEMTITRARRTSARVNGVIGRHVLVRDQRGVLVEEGETAALVTARDATGDDAQRDGRAVPCGAWARPRAAAPRGGAWQARCCRPAPRPATPRSAAAGRSPAPRGRGRWASGSRPPRRSPRRPAPGTARSACASARTWSSSASTEGACWT